MPKWLDRPALLVVFAALFWSGNAVVGRVAVVEVPPVTLAFLRWFIAFGLVMPFAVKAVWNDRAVIARNWLLLAAFGIIGVAAFNTCLYIGLRTTQAINAGLLQAGTPMMIVGFSALLLRERPSWRQLLGLAVAIAGVLAILLKADVEALASLRLNGGDIWVLAGCILYALYSVLLRWRPQMSALSFLAVTFAFSWIGLLPFSLVELAHSAPIPLSAKNLGSIIYVGIFPSVLSYLCFNRAIELVGAARAGMALYLVPMFVSVMAVVLIGEPFHFYHLLGMALILGGVALGSLKASQPERQ